MDWQGWLQTILNGLIAGGIGYGQAWSQGASNRSAIGAAIITGGAAVGGLFQKKPNA